MSSLPYNANRGIWFVIAAAVLWGTTGTAQAFAPEGTHPAVIGTMRLVIGGGALMILALMRGGLRSENKWPRLPIGLGGGAIATYQLCFFAAVARTGVAVGTLIAIGSAPVAGGLLGYLVRDEALTWRWTAATMLAIMGCGLLMDADAGTKVDVIGVILALGAGLSYAIYAIATRFLLEAHAPDAAMAVIFSLGALLLLPLLLIYDTGWLLQARGIVVALHLGLVATALSYVLFARGLITVPVGTAVTLSLAEPLTAGLLGVIVLGEYLTRSGLAGIALLVLGLVLLSTGKIDSI